MSVRQQFACLLGLLAAPLALAQQPQPNQQVLVQQETALVQFIGGGSPLSAAERDQCAAIVDDAMRHHPDAWLKDSENDEAALKLIHSGNATVIGRFYDSERYAYQFEGKTGPLAAYFLLERRIIEAHDPVLFVDVQHHWLVTAHMMVALRAGAQWAASMYAMTPPRTDFDQSVRAQLATLPTLDPAIADGIAHISRYQTLAPLYFSSLTPAARAKFFSNKAAFNHLDEPGMEAWELAETGALEARFASRQVANNSSLSQMIYGSKLQSAWMGNAARSLSPSCNPTLSTSARMQNNCIAPVPVPGIR